MTGLIRVEKGNPDAAELAALTVVLLACAAKPAPPRPRQAVAGWRRWERSPGFGGPRSWRRHRPPTTPR